MEILDLYDRDLNLTGSTMIRGEEIPEGCYIRIVVVFIQNSKGEFLIQKTSAVKGSKMASTGGHFKTGEDSLTTIQTEVVEELGIKIDKSEFEFIDHYFRNCIVFDVYYLNKDIDLNTLNLQIEEVESVNWCSKEDIKNFINKGIFSPSHTEIFNKYIKDRY